MVHIPQRDYTKQPTKQELQQLSDNYRTYAEKFLSELDKLERQSRESKLVVKAVV
jgi:hypothetical protein